ncbi:TonB-dependent receptor [uncultured Cyclobacterium sp.]|uniref:SusC/RagA family TonB-linked outer membrane protein n=1 Tax=uncultured Cyclobacterium sp. TaxID=453820 RepID=UPI0030EF1CB5|tara:strand:+ start:539207 stop:542353 length:3147 start_codon:yes stop_codon:yes gene_type:complete
MKKSLLVRNRVYLPYTRRAFSGLIILLIFLFSPDIGYGNNNSLKPTDIKENERRAAISGTVVDATGEPIPGVTVSVPGTGRGTATDLDGKYTINVDEGTTLVFSFIGFVSQRIQVIDQSIINITLLEDTSSLDEVVVVGYGTQKKENLTGSVSSVKFDDELQNRPLTNASQALSGQVPGVWISQNSGKPGSDGAQIRVRGWGTLNNSNPLILVDGVEASINEINPNDIESMTVLKDAASSAIYGSRAANGVVLITLKSGKFGEKTSINIGSYVGQQSLGRRYEIIENSAEYMGMWNQALANQGGSPLFPESVINDFRNNNDPYVYPNTNFFNEVFKKAPITEHNISVNGGSEQTKFYVSMNYLNQDGIMLNSKSNRYGLTVNLETKLKDWLTVGGRLNGIKKASEEPFNLGRMMYIFANGGYPFTAPYTEDGRFGSVQAINSNGNTIVGNRNPLIETANGLSISENNFFKMNVFANIDFTDYLTLKTNLTSQYNSNLLDKHNNLVYGYTNTGVEGKNLDYLTILEASRSNVQSNYNTLFSTLNFNKTYNEIHNISAIAGIQVESTVIKDVYGRRSGPPKEGLIQIDAGTAGFQANGNMSELRMMSYFGRVNYALSDKYLFEMNLRADGSSRFKEDYRWGIFPAFSAGWRLGEEVFMKSQNLISDLKIRASWGKLGNQNINSYWPYLAVVNQTNGLSYNFSGSFAPGAGITALVDESIGWETSVTTDLGVEFGLLNNRIFVEADYFRKTTSDIIVQLPIPSILGGVSAPFENVGEMTNNGFEFNINYSKLANDRDDVGYNIGVNMTYIANQVTKFRENSPDQLYLIREGFSYRELYGYKATGIYQSDQEASEHMFANGYIPQAGELKYEDVNNDGRLGFEDKMALGNTIPKYTFGLTPSVNYKGFDLSTVIMGIAGASVYTQNAWTQPLGISGGTITEKWRDAWTVDNMSTTVPRISISDTWRSEASSYWVSDISFVKLRNIQLGYTFSSALTERLGLQKLYVYGNAQNVGSLVSKDYEGFDPERNTFDSGDNFYPLPKIISLGVNINL